MDDSEDPLSGLRQRIQAAFDPKLFEAMGHALIARLFQQAEATTSGESTVLNWHSPETNVAVARGSLTANLPTSTESLVERFQQLVSGALARGHNLHNPKYIGHQVPAPVPIAGLFDAIGSITNQVMAVYEMGPWATAIERALIEKLGAQLGLEAGRFWGIVTHGGSLANLTALLTARNVMLRDVWEQGLAGSSRPPVLLAQADSHYCIARSAGILGLGTKQVLKVPLDGRRRMNPRELDAMLTSLRKDQTPIVAVSASACATPIGAFDPLNEVADVCEKHGVWLHVDAAHGGAVAFSEKHRHLIEGIERADSLICDAHKTLFVPALCAFVFYKDGQHRFETFRQEAPYLFDPSAPGMAEYDSGTATLECTKRAAVYGLWGTWALFGPTLFRDMIDVTFETAARLHEMLRLADDFETLHDPECNIVVFRYLPKNHENWTKAEIGELNRRIRRQLIESGEFYIVQTNLDGIGALRVCVMNPLTDESHCRKLLEAIRRLGSENSRNVLSG
ncbi:MAG: hypothetical protein KDA80_04920 [Planctomycetaceae bacterium]|nr:hypothetical protein [Planctomycetaceae bacterium]